MTTIRIDVQDGDYPAPPSIAITSEIQSQLLAPVMERLEALEERCGDIEALHNMEAGIPVAADKPTFTPYTCPKCGSAEQVWANNRDPVYRCHRVSCDRAEAVRTLVAPARTADQPAGDDAAVRVIATILSDTPVASYAEDAKTIIAAIRRGEVPGVWMSSDVEAAATLEKFATLRANLAAITADRDTYKSSLSVERSAWLGAE